MSDTSLFDPTKEHTLILVKPDGYRRGLTGEILRRIEAKGYLLVAMKITTVDRSMLDEHYEEHRERHFYNGLVEYMSSGPVVAVVVQGDHVIQGMRTMMGATNPTQAAPGTIRGDLGREWGTDSTQNLIHGSDSVEAAEKEIALWFPELKN